MDHLETILIESFFSEFYKNHPYGQQTVLGKPEHIKNPSLTKMQAFYDKYYVAGNMALILSGPFDSEEVLRKIKTYFEQLPTGETPEFIAPKEETFNGEEKVCKRLTPIRAGLIGFRTIPTNHPDKAGMEVLHALLSNENETGLLDQLGEENKLMYSLSYHDVREDAGASIFLYVPKILFQRMKKSEKLVFEQIETIKQGNFSDEFLEAIKLSLLKNELQSIESETNRSLKIMECFIYGETWEDELEYQEKIQSISKEEIVSLANKYYGDNYLLFRSRMGFPKKKKLDKPGFDPVKSKNPEANSDFAKELNKLPDNPITPKFITIGNEVKINDFAPSTRLYYVENPTNNVFSLDIKYQISKYENPILEPLSQYLMLSGSEQLPDNQFKKKMQSFACSYDISAGEQYFSVHIDGMEEYLDSCLFYINQLITKPAESKNSLKNIVKFRIVEDKINKNQADIKAKALTEYVMYEDNSIYLNRLSVKDLKKLKTMDYIASIEKLSNCPINIHYSGKTAQNILIDKLSKQFKGTKINKSNKLYTRKIKQYNKSLVYFLDDKKAVQSQIYFYIPGSKDSETDRAVTKAFNKYFGEGMTSLIFQEIRELRSMAYTAYGYYSPGFTKNDDGYLKAFIGTQSDKCTEAINIMDSLLFSFPQKEERIPILINSLKQSINTEKPNFRNISYLVAHWVNQGYQYDPREYYYRVYNDISMKQLYQFQNEHIKDHNMIITIVGNSKNINMDELQQYGSLIKITDKEIMN